MWGGGRPLGQRHDDGGVEVKVAMTGVIDDIMCSKAPRRSLQVIVVSEGCPVRVIID